MVNSRRGQITLLFALGCSTACAAPARPGAALAVARKGIESQARAAPPAAWGIPRFFEVGRRVQLTTDSPPVDTTGWAELAARASVRSPRAYFSGSVDDRSQVFVYPERDPSGLLRRYALIVPEPTVFSTNGIVTAFWGRDPLFMNFALGMARSFGNLGGSSTDASTRALALRARLDPNGVNVQELENVYELENSRLGVWEHKGLIPGESLSFARFAVYDRDAVSDELPPTPIANASPEYTLRVGLVPLREAGWLHRESFEASGCRVVFVNDAEGRGFFLAAPLEIGPGWGFGDASADLTIGPLTAGEGDVGAGSAAALTFEHVNHGVLLSGAVRDKREVAGLLERGLQFIARLPDESRRSVEGVTPALALRMARAFIAEHRSERDPRTITRFPHGDARKPNNGAALPGGARYGQDIASALRGLVAVQRATGDEALSSAIAELAESSLESLTPSGATFARRCDQLAVAAEHDPSRGRADVFIDNGAAAVAINHRRLLLVTGETHAPGITWGAFSAIVAGRRRSVDDAEYAFAIDGESLPHVLEPDATALSVERLFTSLAGGLAIHETARVLRGMPATEVSYRVENRDARPVTLSEVRISLAEFLERGTGANDVSRNQYGLGHVAEGVHLPVGFWMEGMSAPLWGDSFAADEVDLTKQFDDLRARFFLVYGFDRAQIYYLRERPDRLILRNAQGWTGLEARYHTEATLSPDQSYELPGVLSYTLRAPLQSADGDPIPDQLQELAALWIARVSNRSLPTPHSAPSLETGAGHAALVYAWTLVADLLDSGVRNPAHAALRERLRQSALLGSSFALKAVTGLRNQSDRATTYANGHDYGFHLALFDWAYQQTCDSRYRDTFLSLADDLARPRAKGGLQITDPESPGYGGYLSTLASRASGPTNVGDQGIRLWALRLAYERTGNLQYRRSAELFLDHWLRLDPEAHSFVGTVFAAERYRDAGIAEERTPLGHLSVLAGLNAWSDLSERARALYAAGLAAATGRQVAQRLGRSGPRRSIAPHDGVSDFSNEAELTGTFLWATMLAPAALRGRFDRPCRPALAIGAGNSPR